MNNKLFPTISPLLLVFCLALQFCRASETLSEQQEKIHGIIFKAELPNRKSLYFVPSCHSKPLSDFTLLFQKEILQCSALIIERVVELEEKSSDGFLSYFVNFISKEFIDKELDGFVKSDQDKWSLDFDQCIKDKYETFFKEIENWIGKETDCSHFHNIYSMKPGVVLAIFGQFKQLLDNKEAASLNIKGMDNDIGDYFDLEKKPILGLETTLDVINSLSLSTQRLEDIIDDYKTKVVSIPDFNSLEDMHFFILNRWTKKRLWTEASLGIRNQPWINKYDGIVADYPGCIAVHGAAHFIGEKGLLKLGQDRQWNWSVFQVDGHYLPFTYNPNGDTPFHFNT